MFKVLNHRPGGGFSISLVERIQNLSLLGDSFGRDARVEIETVEMQVTL